MNLCLACLSFIEKMHCPKDIVEHRYRVKVLAINILKFNSLWFAGFATILIIAWQCWSVVK